MDGSLLGLVLVFYYVPTMIALWREHPRAGAIYVINFLSGWTFIGGRILPYRPVTTSRNSSSGSVPSRNTAS